jgi:hypothetical protein
MTVKFISVYDDKPKTRGWYATLHCWEVQEGFSPGAAFWNGAEFTTNLPISNWVDRVFDSEQDANGFAFDNDPNW